MPPLDGQGYNHPSISMRACQSYLGTPTKSNSLIRSKLRTKKHEDDFPQLSWAWSWHTYRNPGYSIIVCTLQQICSDQKMSDIYPNPPPWFPAFLKQRGIVGGKAEEGAVAPQSGRNPTFHLGPKGQGRYMSWSVLVIKLLSSAKVPRKFFFGCGHIDDQWYIEPVDCSLLCHEIDDADNGSDVKCTLPSIISSS